MKIYVYKTEDEIECISSVQTAQTPTEAELKDSAFYFDKLPGYVIEYDDAGILILHFSDEKYKQKQEEKKKQEEAQRLAEQAEQNKQDLLNMLSVTTEPSDKKGCLFKVFKIGDVVVKKEYIPENDILNDGTDYTKPITYKEGMSVSTGLWYTDGNDIWECKKDGVPGRFGDNEFFDVIKVIK